MGADIKRSQLWKSVEGEKRGVCHVGQLCHQSPTAHVELDARQ